MESSIKNQNGWATTKAGKHLQERLNETRTVEAIDRLLDRIETLESAVEQLTVVMERAPGMVSMVADMADEGYRKAAQNGVDIEQRLANALTIAEKLTAPEMVEKLESLLQFTDHAPGLISMTVDMADEGYRKAAQNGVDIEQRLGAALQLAEQLTAPEMVEKLESLLTLVNQAPGLVAMTADMFDEGMANAFNEGIDLTDLATYVKVVTKSLSQAQHMPETKVGGIFSMLRALRDPDRQKALGFLMNFAKVYGQQLP